MINSNEKLFRYELIWEKSRPTGFIHAKNKVLKKHENILIFSKGNTNHENISKNRMTYNPQNLIKISKIKKNSHFGIGLNGLVGVRPSQVDYLHQEFTNYPTSVLKFNSEHNKDIHPTQKPVDLCEYLIRTFSNENEIVLDNCIGSGTTAIASMRCNRKFIGIEKKEKYYKMALKRIDDYKFEEVENNLLEAYFD